MYDWSLAGLFLMTCFVAFGVNASVTGGGGADGATRDALTGTSWNLVALMGEDIDPALPTVTLHFDVDGTLGGFDGCNRYRGAFSVAGTAIHIPSEMATTRAACREPLASCFASVTPISPAIARCWNGSQRFPLSRRSTRLSSNEELPAGDSTKSTN
ncbi:MAG: META domain-containing protein [Gammaproteobacteria bacterium]|jgi:heat shock protein HslJ